MTNNNSRVSMAIISLVKFGPKFFLPDNQRP
jgi:hypothetical protein